MRESKNQRGNLQVKQNKNRYSLIKKTAFTAVIGLGLTFNVASADDDALTTIYHVYVEGEHVGIVDSKDVVENYLDSRIEDKQSDYNKDYNFIIAEDINYIPEKVFDGSAENRQVKESLDEEVSVKVEAYELKIGDRVLGYFKDKETAEATIQDLKTKYVDSEILEKIEQRKDEEKETNDLSVGESIIVDVKLSEEVSLSEEKVAAKEIISKEDGLKLLEKGTLEDKVHTVKTGDTLFSIALEYDLNMEELLELNADLTEDSILQIDQEVNVTDYEPYVQVLIKEEELVENEINYSTEVIKSDELYVGQEKVRQQGQTGKKRIHYALEKVNNAVVSKEKLDEDIIKEPVKEIIVKGTKVVPSRGTSSFKWPAVGGSITSHVGHRWGSYHKGIDIAGVSNRTIMAADNGVVESAGWNSGGYGNKVVINHQNGYKTVYAHLSSISVSAGQSVPKGTKIGVMGSTGNSTGVHLHFEVYKNGSLVNPASLF